MLLRCCLLHINISIRRYILCLVYLCLCLGLVQFMSYLHDPVFISNLIFIVINHTISLRHTRQTQFFAYLLEYLILVSNDNMNEESVKFSNSKSSASGCCLAFANFSLMLLIKVLLMKKTCNINIS